MFHGGYKTTRMLSALQGLGSANYGNKSVTCNRATSRPSRMKGIESPGKNSVRCAVTWLSGERVGIAVNFNLAVD